MKKRSDQQGLEEGAGPRPASRSRAAIIAYHCCLLALSFGVVTAFQSRRTQPDRRHLPEPTEVRERTLSNQSRSGTSQGGTLHQSVDDSKISYDRLDLLLKDGHQSSLAEAGCILSELASRDPEKALDFLLSHNWPTIPPSLKTLLADIWAEKSYSQALAVLRGCPDRAVRTELECRMIHSLSRVDPARATQPERRTRSSSPFRRIVPPAG